MEHCPQICRCFLSLYSFLFTAAIHIILLATGLTRNLKKQTYICIPQRYAQPQVQQLTTILEHFACQEVWLLVLTHMRSIKWLSWNKQCMDSLMGCSLYAMSLPGGKEHILMHRSCKYMYACKELQRQILYYCRLRKDTKRNYSWLDCRSVPTKLQTRHGNTMWQNGMKSSSQTSCCIS